MARLMNEANGMSSSTRLLGQDVIIESSVESLFQHGLIPATAVSVWNCSGNFRE